MTIAFPGETLPVLGDLARLANEAHRKAEDTAVSALEYAREAGEHLSNAKAQCRHGEWLPWLEANFDGTRNTAAKYMRLSTRWHELDSNVSEPIHLTIESALALLAEPRALPDSPGIFDEPEGDDERNESPEPYQPEPSAPSTADEAPGPLGQPEPTAQPFTAEPAAADQSDRPHVAHNSGNNEWYTPTEYVDAARYAMGGIDLDPASSEVANRTVKADVYYTAEDDGLSRAWGGRVFLNPPYSGDLVGRFAAKTLEELEAGTVEQAVVLVNNATETGWFQALAERADAICFPKGRIRYLDHTGQVKQSPLQGQAFLYFGPNAEHFAGVFSAYGVVK